MAFSLFDSNRPVFDDPDIALLKKICAILWNESNEGGGGGGTPALSVTAFPPPTTAAFASVTTSGTAGTYVVLAAVACKLVVFNNNSGVDVTFQRGGAGSGFTLSSGQAITFPVLANASELGISLATTGSAKTLVYETVSY